MTSERINPHQSENLKFIVSNNLRNLNTNYTAEQSPYAFMTEGLFSNFASIKKFSIWDEQKSDGEIRNSIGSFCAAIHYAYIKAGQEEKFLQLYQSPSSIKMWSSIIQEVHENSEMRQVFEENAWRPPVTLFSERGIPLQKILSDKFKDKKIKGVDLGAGFNTAFSFLNSQFYMDYYASQGIDVQQVNMTFGLGVDIQEPDPDWVRACIWPIEGFRKKVESINSSIEDAKEAAEKLNEDGDVIFPSLIADITADGIVEKIQDRIPDEGDGKQVDVVVTSFIDQLVDDREAVRIKILRLLKTGGIWIKMGHDPEASSDDKLNIQHVEVYEKRDDEFTKPEKPFILLNRVTPIINLT